MRSKSGFVCAAFGAALAWSVAGQAVPGTAGEKQPAKDSQLAQLHMSLRGVSG